MPIKESVTIDEAIDLLNSAIKADKRAMHNLIEARVMCNKELANHPTIQISSYHVEGQYVVGLLGILNGLFGIDKRGWGAIAAVFGVICLNKHVTQPEDNVGDPCAVCGEKLLLGALESFQRTQALNKED